MHSALDFAAAHGFLNVKLTGIVGDPKDLTWTVSVSAGGQCPPYCSVHRPDIHGNERDLRFARSNIPRGNGVASAGWRLDGVRWRRSNLGEIAGGDTVLTVRGPVLKVRPMVLCARHFCVVVVLLAGCEAAKPPEAPIPTAEATNKPETAKPETPKIDLAAANGSTPASDPAAAANEAKPISTGPLDLDGVSLIVPEGWQRVDPPTSRIVEAEFAIPKAEGDEFDGRLTIMAAGGGRDDNIGRWRGEFVVESQDDAKTEALTVSGVESTKVDIRGTWKGPSFKPVPPRENYRMLAVIVPTGQTAAYYVKLVGPKATMAANAEKFDAFVSSMKLKQ